MSGKCCCKFKRLNSGHVAHPHYDSGYAISCKLVELSTTLRFSGANGKFVEISIGSSLRHVRSFPHDLHRSKCEYGESYREVHEIDSRRLVRNLNCLMPLLGVAQIWHIGSMIAECLFQFAA
jgi:hypothetical protein